MLALGGQRTLVYYMKLVPSKELLSGLDKKGNSSSFQDFHSHQGKTIIKI